MKNYYEILEVDKQASFEVIDKAYRVLAKKYHPDKNTESNKILAEEQFKKINEAYSVLSNIETRKAYDKKLASVTVDYSKKYEELLEQQALLKNELQELKKQNGFYNEFDTKSSSSPISHNTNDPNSIHYYSSNATHNINNSNHENPFKLYNKILNNLLYCIRQKKTFKDFIALILTILILLFIILVLWNIPYTKNYLISFYENNNIIKGIVDFFIQ